VKSNVKHSRYQQKQAGQQSSKRAPTAALYYTFVQKQQHKITGVFINNESNIQRTK